ncbi:MAG: histidine phosphatase family protein [Acidobacteriia bacterium]|nr:histidine phosphatase family protein [Terriglobia bacterium]
MSTLTLVRHGQALPFQDDPDRLSELGRRQTKRLAQYWLRHGLAFDEMVSGSLRRHIETVEIIRASMREAGLPQAPFREDPRFNEYDSAGIQRELAPRIAEANPGFAAVLTAWTAHRGTADQNRHFQEMFEALLQEWRAEGWALSGVERWPVFHARVQKGLQDILQAEGRSRRVFVVTSGGPIGVAVQSAVGAPAASAIDIHWRLRNSSLTEFLFSGTKMSLDLFNATPHLEPELQSFR